uniref:Uncharacterized protein n=1 Tax=Rhodosorus marinus TaxID=101924 RepID=A0A7S0BMV1_9RHOD
MLVVGLSDGIPGPEPLSFPPGAPPTLSAMSLASSYVRGRPKYTNSRSRPVSPALNCSSFSESAISSPSSMQKVVQIVDKTAYIWTSLLCCPEFGPYALHVVWLELVAQGCLELVEVIKCLGDTVG